MAIFIRDTGHVVSKRQAKKWLADHVVISREDLRRIEKLARKLGAYRKLKALDIEIFGLAESRDT